MTSFPKLHFHFMGEYSKRDRVKTMGTRWKINAIWWNIKINLQKLVHTTYMWTSIANKFAKFNAKRLNWSENIPKSFKRATFLKHPVYDLRKTQSISQQSRFLWPSSFLSGRQAQHADARYWYSSSVCLSVCHIPVFYLYGLTLSWYMAA